MAAPPNDDLINAELLVGIEGSVHRTNVDATIDVPFDPINDGLGGSETVWFKVALPVGWTERSRLIFACRADSGDNSDLYQYIFTMFDSIPYPPTGGADISVWEAGAADNERVEVTSFVPENGFIYFGVGTNNLAGGFTLSYVLDVPIVDADLPVRIFITDGDSQTISLFDHRAKGRQFLYRLDAPAYHTGQVASDDPDINRPFPDPDSPANLTHNRRLLFALSKAPGNYPPYHPIFGGIVNVLEDQGADAATTRYTANDPWQYLMSRPVRDPITFALPSIDGLKFPDQSRASDIALALLDTSQIVDGETHIEYLSGTIGSSSPLNGGITFDQGLSVGEAWTQLCDTGTIDIHLDPMYEPESYPGKVVRLRIIALNDGEAAGTVLYDTVMAWDLPGHSLMSISRLVDGTRMANRVQFYAGQGGVRVPLQSDVDSIAAYGEYWAQQMFPGTQDRRLVTLIALTQLLIRRNGGRSITFDPAPERVGTVTWLNLGDYLPVWASRNLREPLGVDYDAFNPNDPGASGYQRIYAIPLDVDDNGVTFIRGLLTSKEDA